MSTSSLFSFLSGITELSPAFTAALSTRLREERYIKNQAIHVPGGRENRMFFVQSGFMRNYYYDHRSNQHTARFWEPGDILFSFEGYYNLSAYFYTEVIGRTELITLSYDDLHELDLQFPEVGFLIKAMLLAYQQEEYAKQELIAMPADERYQQLRKTKPKLFQKASITDIASYLNLTREGLSRIMSRG